MAIELIEVLSKVEDNGRALEMLNERSKGWKKFNVKTLVITNLVIIGLLVLLPVFIYLANTHSFKNVLSSYEIEIIEYGSN